MLNFNDPGLFRKLDSLTKYPSIPTFHALLDGKTLKEEIQVDFSGCGTIYATEKVDGTNMRIVSIPQCGLFLGTRDKLICKFDIPNGEYVGEPACPNDPIHELKKLICRSQRTRIVFECMPHMQPDAIKVFYFEMFGGRIGPHKHYTSTNEIDLVMLDVCEIHDYAKLLEMPVERISSWREHSGQKYLALSSFWTLAEQLDVNVVHNSVFIFEASQVSVHFAWNWLTNITPKRSRFAMDDAASGVVEGLVIRTYDRSKIAKLRFEDYERTLGLR